MEMIPPTKMLKKIIRQSYRYFLFYVYSRKEIPHILNQNGLTGIGAEVGVKHGKFSEVLLKQWEGDTLYSVDPWKSFPDEQYTDNANVSQQKLDTWYKKAKDRLSKFGNRSKILRQTSLKAARQFDDETLDFVYIDAQHHYEAVKQDINVWWPKIKKGGILSGHDYLDGTFEEGDFGVKSAVDEFVDSNELNLIVTRETRWKSWIIFK